MNEGNNEIDIKQRTDIARTGSREIALHDAKNFLKNLPMRRAIVVVKALKDIEGIDKPFYGIGDLIVPKAQWKNSSANLPKNSEIRKLKGRIDKIDSSDEVEQLNQKQPPEAEQPFTTSIASGEEQGTVALRELATVIDPYGAILLNPQRFPISESPLKDFFTHYRRFGRFEKNNGKVDLRGLDYFLATDSQRDIFQKFDAITMTIKDGVKAATSIDRKNIANPGDYLLLLGIADYLKAHTTLLFHCLTFNERNLDATLHTPEYEQRRVQAAKIMIDMTSFYYDVFLGREFNNDAFSNLMNSIDAIVGASRSEVLKYATDGKEYSTAEEYSADPEKERWEQKAMSSHAFRVPDVQNPITILLGARNVVEQHNDIDVVVGIPSGGTEGAIVTQMLYEIRGQKKPEIAFLPVSLHSRFRQYTQEELTSYVSHAVSTSYKDKKILLVDDNAPTGETFSTVADALMDNGATSVATHAIEFDASRLIWKKNFLHPFRLNSRTTVGLTKLTDTGVYAKIKDDRDRTKNLQAAVKREEKRIQSIMKLKE